MAAVLAVGALIAPPSQASGLQVSPIGLNLAASAPADALWLTNTGNDTVHAQVRVFRWTQVDGKDVLEPSRDLVVSPPMITIAPGERQMVRVIRQVAPPDGVESAYRVLVDELPVDGGTTPGLKFVLRYSIPVFLSPAGDPTVRATLEATWEDSPSGPTLRVRNAGKAHAQIADVNWRNADGQRTALLSGLVGYALPGSTMSWHVPGPLPQGSGDVRARINGEVSESTLVVDADRR